MLTLGRHLVYLSDRDMPLFRVLLSPSFPRTGFEKKATFSGAGFQNMSKREILSDKAKFFCLQGKWNIWSFMSEPESRH